MSLEVGQKLGDYTILDAIGAGGMGEVYRARDTKLGREVAVKILPDDFGGDERRRRFEREARLLASLSHPHVATLHGFFEHDGKPFLVMELVPGETLEERLAASGRLGIDECVTLCRQIAEGLAAAHEKGIVHRDLKPANIKITPDGRAVVLDFGLAKALVEDTPTTDMSQSPTVSAGATRAGVILGTAAYMSPEQARGKPLDRRTDVWSFAVVLFEALTGKKAFDGQTVTDVLAAIVGKEPDWTALPGDTPWRIRDLIRRSLRKDPARRLDAMSAARLDLEDALEDDEVMSAPSTPFRRRLGGYFVSAAAAAVLVWTMLPHPEVPDRPITRFSIELPHGHALSSYVGSLAMSPDGHHVVYVDMTDDNRLYWRPVDRVEAIPLPGTENAAFPFFSPDSRSVAYFDRAGGLKKVSLEGGRPVILAPDIRGSGQAWSPDGNIYAARLGGNALWRVSSGGGQPEQIYTSPGESFVLPRYLPEGNALLFQTSDSVSALNLVSGNRSTVLENAEFPGYANGYLVFSRRQDPMLYAVPFDATRVETVGAPVALGEVLDAAPNQSKQFALASNGDLVMATAGLSSFEIVWVDRSGTAEPITSELRAYHRLRLSPHGDVLAASISYPDRARDLSLYDLERGTFRRFTFDPGTDTGPVWSPDGASILFVSTRSGKHEIHRKASDGTGDPTQLTDLPEVPVPHAVTPDGRKVLFHTETERDIRALDLEDGSISSVVVTEADEWQPVLSPDGRWLAYLSDASGQNEIMVQPYPSLNGIWQVSTGGGVEPLWSRDGRELFYRNGSRMMSVAVETSSGFQYGTPKLLFDAPYELDPSNDTSNYDVAADGRFLMIRRSPTVRTQLTVIQGFRKILEEKVGGTR